MAQNPWTVLNNAMRGQPPQSGGRRPPVSEPVRPNTRTYTEAQAQEQARANQQREMQAAIARTQAARPSRPLTAAEIAQIRARYQ